MTGAEAEERCANKHADVNILGERLRIEFSSTSTSCSSGDSGGDSDSFSSDCPGASFPVFISHFSPPLAFGLRPIFFPSPSAFSAAGPTIGTSLPFPAASAGFGDFASAAFFAAAAASRKRCPMSAFSASFWAAAALCLASMARRVDPWKSWACARRASAVR